MGCNVCFQHVALVKDRAKRYDLNRAISSPQAAARAFKDILHMDELDVENFCVIYLNTKKEIVGVHTLTIGLINKTLVGIGDVFKIALLHGANNVIVAHNHPSGDTEPSREDITTTKRLVEAGRILDIDVCDHLIFGTGSNTWISLCERGYI